MLENGKFWAMNEHHFAENSVMLTKAVWLTGEKSLILMYANITCDWEIWFKMKSAEEAG